MCCTLLGRSQRKASHDWADEDETLAGTNSAEQKGARSKLKEFQAQRKACGEQESDENPPLHLKTRKRLKSLHVAPGKLVSLAFVRNAQLETRQLQVCSSCSALYVLLSPVRAIFCPGQLEPTEARCQSEAKLNDSRYIATHDAASRSPLELTPHELF